MKRSILYLMALSLLIVGSNQAYAQSIKDRNVSVSSSKTKAKAPTQQKKVKSLPSNHTTVNHNSTVIHVDNGKYYNQKKKTTYVPVAPPFGLKVNSIPTSRKLFRFNNLAYYCVAGIIYQAVNSGGYVVVQPEIGMIVPELPEVNVSRVIIDGVSYFEFEGVLYKQIPTDVGIQYQVVGNL